MELTGKAKDDFLDWWYDHDVFDESWDILKVHNSLKYGLLVDFFDTKNILTEIQLRTEPVMEGVNFRSYRPEIIYKNRYHNVKASFGKRHIARTEAIKKANELYNNA